MKKIGVFGGSFDPIHIAHLIVAQKSYEQAKLDKVIFVPTGVPPHKVNLNATPEQRYEMVKLSIEDNRNFSLSRFEIDKKDYSYTIDLLNHFSKDDINIYLIIGDDSFFNIHKWKNYREIIKKSNIIIYRRKYSNQEIISKAKEYDIEVIIVKSPIIDISSSFIREEIKNENSVKYMLDENVRNYILKKDIYIENKRNKSKG